MNKLKVELVSRYLGRHKGQDATLLIDALMVERAFDSARAIAVACGWSVNAMDDNRDRAIDTTLNQILLFMEKPAIDLLSDYRDSYTATENDYLQLQFTENGVVNCIAMRCQIVRENECTVRVNGIHVEVYNK